MEWLEQSRELEQRGEIGRAIDVLEQAIAIGDETSEICKETARLCLIVNEVRAFTNYCHEAMRLDPADPEPHLMIGRVLSQFGRWEEASEALEHVLSMPALTPEQRAESEQLADTARAKYQEWKRDKPGFSNL
jgi:tetratricopeptide (TPR) repeat protein